MSLSPLECSSRNLFNSLSNSARVYVFRNVPGEFRTIFDSLLATSDRIFVIVQSDDKIGHL